MLRRTILMPPTLRFCCLRPDFISQKPVSRLCKTVREVSVNSVQSLQPIRHRKCGPVLAEGGNGLDAEW